MADTTAFKQKAGETWGKAKETGKKAWDKTKEGTKKAWDTTKKTASETSSDWKKAYGVGYDSGTNDFEKVATRFGAKTMASIGYHQGLKEGQRNAKYLKKINKDK